MSETGFVDMIPFIAAILGPTLGFMLYSLRAHHKDNLETRDLIHRTNQETRDSLTGLIHRTNQETRDSLTGLIERTNQETRDSLTGLIERTNQETREAAERDHAELRKDHHKLVKLVTRISDSLADVRERLAGIEGHLGIGRWSRPEENSDPAATTA